MDCLIWESLHGQVDSKGGKVSQNAQSMSKGDSIEFRLAAKRADLDVLGRFGPFWCFGPFEPKEARRG